MRGTGDASVPLENRRLVEIAPLPTPRAVRDGAPVSARAAERVTSARRAVADALHGRDATRLVVVVGPCSLHDEEAALEYAGRLSALFDTVREELVLVMRTYFEKPRTTLGWKGLVNDPHLDGSCDVPAGLVLARRILLAVNEMGVPCASEVLDPITPQYLGDLLAWAGIGARTAESQTHREIASGLSMPVGFKNGTDGGLDVARNAMLAAGRPHTFLGVTEDGAAAVVRTTGNPDRHLVLRGGSRGPNHDPESVAGAAAAAEDVSRPVLVDCAHGNSGKDPRRQAQVFRSVLDQVRAGQRSLLGLAVESHLHGGRQDPGPRAGLRYGVSVTDPCLGWEETEDLLHEAAEAVKVSR